MISMICAAVSGVMTISTMAAITRFIQASSGILPRVMPGQRMHRIGGDDVDGGADAAEAGDEDGERPVVGAVARARTPCAVSGA